jgi:hypothetical protein
MEIPILLERLDGGRYRARVGEPFAFTVEAAGRTEAIIQADQAIKARPAAGAELIPLPISNPGTIHGEAAGCLKDHPLFDEWVEIMAENRRREDAQNP